MPVFHAVVGFGRHFDDEIGALELQRRQFGHDRRRQRDRRAVRAVPTSCAAASVIGVRARRQPASPGRCSRSSPASRSARSAAIVSRSSSQIVDRHTECLRAAARSANSRSSARLEPLRIVLGRPQRRIDARLRRVERQQRLVERLDHVVEQAGRLRRLALQPPQQAGELRQRRIGAGQHVLRILDFGGDLFGPHHRGAHVRQDRFPRRAAGRACDSSATEARR